MGNEEQADYSGIGFRLVWLVLALWVASRFVVGAFIVVMILVIGFGIWMLLDGLDEDDLDDANDSDSSGGTRPL